MKPYSDYSAEELAMENLFIRWVRFPDDPSMITFWENWMVKYPAQKDNVAKARELVLTASDWKPDTLTNQEVNSIWGRIRSSLDIMADRDQGEQAHGKPHRGKIGGIIWGIVSMAVLVILYIIFFSYLG